MKRATAIQNKKARHILEAEWMDGVGYAYGTEISTPRVWWCVVVEKYFSTTRGEKNKIYE